MSYNPNPVPAGSVTAEKLADGAVTTDKLGGDVTTQAKTLLQAATDKDQRGVLSLDESATSARGLTL